jgi:hypothetical protein
MFINDRKVNYLYTRELRTYCRNAEMSPDPQSGLHGYKQHAQFPKTNDIRHIINIKTLIIKHIYLSKNMT